MPQFSAHAIAEVIVTHQPYTDLYALFRRDPKAEVYFSSLPPYVQDQLTTRYRAVDSLDRLRDYAMKAQDHLFEYHYPF